MKNIVEGIIFIVLAIGTLAYLFYLLVMGYGDVRYGDPLYFEKEQLKLIDNCHKLGGKVIYNEFNKFSSCLER